MELTQCTGTEELGLGQVCWDMLSSYSSLGTREPRKGSGLWGNVIRARIGPYRRAAELFRESQYGIHCSSQNVREISA